MKHILFIISVLFLSGNLAMAVSESSLKNSISDIQDNINSANAEINYYQDQIDKLDHSLDHVHGEIGTLESRLRDIFSDISNTNQKLESYDKQAAAIQEKQNQLQELIIALNNQKQKLSTELQLILTQLYLEAENAGVFDNEDLRFLKLVLNDQTANEILQDLDNLSHIEQILVSSIQKLEKNVSDLDQKDKELAASLERNKAIQQEILLEKQQLSGLIEAQNNLIQIQRNKQATLQDLINRSKAQQEQSRRELQNLATKKSEIEDKLTKLRLERERKSNANAQRKDINLGTNFIWPVNPVYGISAHFQDQEYIKIFGVAHNAIDLPLKMQTPIKSPEDAVVIKVRGGSGLDYHYVILEHGDGIRTLYGHLYRIFVNEGDVISKGQVFALSGGMPGTTGAGFMTTGAHLHLEFSKNGVYVNPLNYLP